MIERGNRDRSWIIAARRRRKTKAATSVVIDRGDRSAVRHCNAATAALSRSTRGLSRGRLSGINDRRVAD